MKKLLSLIIILFVSLGVQAQESERPSQFIVELTVQIDSQPVILVHNNRSIIVPKQFYRGRIITLQVQLDEQYTLIVNGDEVIPFSLGENSNGSKDMRVIASIIQ